VNSYVVDASVAAKWFLPPAGETLVPEALQLLDDFAAARLRICVPDLFWAELGNILWKAVRFRRMSRKAAEDAVRLAAELNVGTVPSLSFLSEALDIALTFERTVYDSIYVAQAFVSRMVLVTADERLANGLAAHLPVRWLGSML
jgi:predicted nucleic acid-binding protein